MYHGPKEQTMPFFNSLGFKLPERKGVADFLQEVTSEKDQQVSFQYIQYLLAPELNADTMHLRSSSTVLQS